MKYILGIGLILFAVIVLGGTFLPIISHEIDYDISRINSPTDIKVITPIDTDFGIVIPKIGANAHITKNVDPFNSPEYQIALSKGVAHAQGTVLPGERGNIFLFSHSSSDFLNATKYNSIFYLLSKLEKEDKVQIFYKQKEYKYIVSDKKIVDSDAIDYLSSKSEDETLTLMTCWPPGTSLKRLIIQARRLL